MNDDHVGIMLNSGPSHGQSRFVLDGHAAIVGKILENLAKNLAPRRCFIRDAGKQSLEIYGLEIVANEPGQLFAKRFLREGSCFSVEIKAGEIRLAGSNSRPLECDSLWFAHFDSEIMIRHLPRAEMMAKSGLPEPERAPIRQSGTGLGS